MRTTSRPTRFNVSAPCGIPDAQATRREAIFNWQFPRRFFRVLDVERDARWLQERLETRIALRSAASDALLDTTRKAPLFVLRILPGFVPTTPPRTPQRFRKTS